MPMIPPAMNLPGNVAMIPSIMFREPKEGRNSITQVADWALPLSRSLEAYSVNLANNATLEFSQICSLMIDNSDCGADLDFIFPDTDVTVSIPAYAPYTVVNVQTQQVQFFIRAYGAIPGDVTRYSICNYSQPPISIPIFVQQQVASISSIDIDGADVTQIIAAGVNGSLRGITINSTWRGAPGDFNNLFSLVDGDNSIIWQGNLAASSGSEGQYLMVDLLGLNVRFLDGVSLVQTGGGIAGGTVDVNLYYRAP